MSDFDFLSEFLFTQQSEIAAGVKDLSGQKANVKDKMVSGKKHRAVFGQDDVFERYAINVSVLNGSSLPKVALPDKAQYAGQPFKVCGISMIFHAHNPYVPTMHANVRLFCLTDQPVFWFGGGLDLTPCYVDHEDVVSWHQKCAEICEQSGVDYAPMKARCDSYFYLPHRKEYRGVGGLFFENMSDDFDQGLTLSTKLVKGIMDAYFPIVKRQMHRAYSNEHKQFQSIRRGRYVEFNLLYDRGTHFGFALGADPDAVLVSMPPGVSWAFDFKPNAEQLASMMYFKQAKDYLAAAEVI